MKTLPTNIQYAFRILSKKRLLSLVVIGTLAIGIGTSSAIFSFVNSILLQPLPFHEPDRLVIIETVKGGEKGRISQRELWDIRETTTAFEDVAGYIPGAQYNLTGQGEPEEIPANICSQNFFNVIGVDFILGSAWPEDYDLHRAFGIVLTEELWNRKFNRDPSFINGTITLDAYEGYTVFGVLPAGFDFPKGIQMFRSGAIVDSQVHNRTNRNRIGIARLRGDATIEKAREELTAVGKQLRDQYPESNGAISFVVMPLRDLYFGPIKPYIILVGIAVLVVLSVACVNVSNLLLSSGAERDKEVAVRSIMGARRQSIISQFLTESVLLSFTGGLLGILFCTLLLQLFEDNLSKDLPHWIDVGINVSVLGFAVGISVLCGLIAGLAPALKITQFNLVKLLKESKGSSGGAHRHRLRKSLVVIELSLSIILLIGTLLLLKSFDALKRRELGFNPDNILTYRVALPWRKYTQPFSPVPFYRQLLEEVRRIPGVKAAALNDNLPLSYELATESRDDEFTVDGQSFEEQKNNPYVKYQIVSPSYREMMGIPLIKGRWITEYDDTLTTMVAVINRNMAESFFKGEDPIGKKIKFGKPDSPSRYRTIVGVVGDVRHDDLRKSEGHHVYLSCWQTSAGNQFVLLKTEGPPMQYAQAGAKAVWTVDGDQSVYQTRTMHDIIDQKLWQDRVVSEVFTLFAIISALLTAVGIYSVMSYAIALRTKEFGVRRVLGASTQNILGIVFTETLVMALISMVVGVIVAAALVNTFSHLLFGVDKFDLGIYVTVPIAACSLALLAALIPALRATGINPVTALKNE